MKRQKTKKLINLDNVTQQQLKRNIKDKKQKN